MGRPVLPLIGQDHPASQMRFERREGVEVQRGEAIALRVFHAGFGLAFGPGAIRRTRARLHVPVAAEREIAGMKPHRAGRAITPGDQRSRIVPQQRARHPAEVREGRPDPFAPIVLALREKGFDEQPP